MINTTTIISKNPTNVKFAQEYMELEARFSTVKRKESFLEKIVNLIKAL